MVAAIEKRRGEYWRTGGGARRVAMPKGHTAVQLARGTIESGLDELLPRASLASHAPLPYAHSSACRIAHISRPQRYHLRRSRYIGLAKTRLLHLLIATALNFVRTAAWLADIPLAHTRRSPFATLMTEPLAA